MLDWFHRYGELPTSYDWSRTHANRRGGIALKRLNTQEWPPASVVGPLFGGWDKAGDAGEAAARLDSALRRM